MAPKIHPNTKWLTPSQAVALTGLSRSTIRRMMTERDATGRIPVRSKENPRRRSQGGRLAHRGDLETKVLYFT